MIGERRTQIAALWAGVDVVGFLLLFLWGSKLSSLLFLVLVAVGLVTFLRVTHPRGRVKPGLSIFFEPAPVSRLEPIVLDDRAVVDDLPGDVVVLPPPPPPLPEPVPSPLPPPPPPGPPPPTEPDEREAAASEEAAREEAEPEDWEGEAEAREAEPEAREAEPEVAEPEAAEDVAAEDVEEREATDALEVAAVTRVGPEDTTDDEIAVEIAVETAVEPADTTAVTIASAETVEVLEADEDDRLEADEVDSTVDTTVETAAVDSVVVVVDESLPAPPVPPARPEPPVAVAHPPFVLGRSPAEVLDAVIPVDLVPDATTAVEPVIDAPATEVVEGIELVVPAQRDERDEPVGAVVRTLEDIEAEQAREPAVAEPPVTPSSKVVDDEAVTDDADILRASEVAALELEESQAEDARRRQIYLLNKIRLELDEYE